MANEKETLIQNDVKNLFEKIQKDFHLEAEDETPRFPEELLGHPQLSDPPYAPILEPEHPSKKEKE